MLKVGDWYRINYAYGYDLYYITKLENNPNYFCAERYSIDEDEQTVDYAKQVRFNYIIEGDSVYIDKNAIKVPSPSDMFITLYKNEQEETLTIEDDIYGD